MGNILFYQDIVREELANQENRRKTVELYKPLVRTAIEFACKFSKNHKRNWGDKTRGSDLSFALGFNSINCLSLNLRLAEKDSIAKDVGPLIEELSDHPRLEFKEDAEYIEMGWVGWSFKLKGKFNGHTPELLVRAWFENATACKKVGTGEFEEKMKVVCEE